MTPRSRISVIAATTGVLIASLLGSAGPAMAADLIGAQLCVSSTVTEPATLIWNYPQGHPSHWFDGRSHQPSCATGRAVQDLVSLEAHIHFGGPVLHQTWELLVDPADQRGDLLYDLHGPGGVGGMEVLTPGGHHSYTANGVTATITWVSTSAGRPHLRLALSPAA